MKGKLLFIILTLSLTSFLNFKLSDDNPKRFTKPHEEEANEVNKFQKPFMDFEPKYTSSVFINYNISRDSAPQNETSSKISRKDPNRVVAAWRDFRIGVTPAVRRVGYSYSTDGGTTWSVSKLLDSTLLPNLKRASDPAVGIDSAGNFYVAVIALTNSNGNGTLAVFKSTDGGVTFPIAIIAAQSGSEDKEYIATDLTPGSPYKNNIYMSWTRFSGQTGIKLTKSTNSGVNWSAAVAISDVTGGIQGSDLCVGLNGEIYVTWLDGNATNDIIRFDKSTNGGNSFGTDLTIAQGTSPIIPISTGATFPSIATDISGGPRNGYIYVTWCDARNGDPDIFISRSINGGNNWSTPVRVNNDAIGNGKLQFWPWIGVNDSGYIAIVYYDTRNTPSNNIIEAYLAHSTDGGLTFRNDKLSTQQSPTNQPNGDVRFGDYIGIDYWKDRVVPVWTDERAGGFNMECYTAIVSTPVNINSFANQIPDRFELKQNYPNPFNPTTKINFELPSAISGTNYVSLKIYDVLGNEVATLVNEFKQAGRYNINFDGTNLSSGVYFYKLVVIPSTRGNSLEAADFVAVKRMILIK